MLLSNNIFNKVIIHFKILSVVLFRDGEKYRFETINFVFIIYWLHFEKIDKLTT